jgi:hypothetical protein
MSWDVSVHRFSREYDTVEEIPDTERPLPLGTRAEVHALISQYFLGTDWSDPAWGLYDCPHGSIEFNVGDDEPTAGFMMHVRASGEVVLSIVSLCRAAKWQAIDCSTGAFLEKAIDPAEGLRAWQVYRDRVVGDS